MEGESMRNSPQSVAAWNDIAAQTREAAASTPRRGGGSVSLVGFESLPTEQAQTGVPPDAARPFLGNELWVNAEGAIAPCCAPDAERLELGSFGRVENCGDILAAWRSRVYSELMESYPQKAVCAKCTMRRRL